MKKPINYEIPFFVHHIRFFLGCDEVARLVFGQAGLHQGPDLGVLALGVELLAGALGHGGGGIYLR
jgi:hypothetical protein